MPDVSVAAEPGQLHSEPSVSCSLGKKAPCVTLQSETCTRSVFFSAFIMPYHISCHIVIPSMNVLAIIWLRHTAKLEYFS